jgi:hypothetical protein
MGTIRLQLKHERQEHSNPYIAEIEAALDGVKAGGLKERGWDRSDMPGIIRYETGPEIIVIAAGLVELTVAILHLVTVTRKHHPETTVDITVTDPGDLERVLRALGKTSPK